VLDFPRPEKKIYLARFERKKREGEDQGELQRKKEDKEVLVIG
jgi:hypothetical protein